MPDKDPAGRVLDVVHEVAAEYMAARRKWPPMNSGHEGYAVILEEVDELEEAIAAVEGAEMAKARVAPIRRALDVVWANVKGDRPAHEAARLEAIQVAAMAVAYVLEVCDDR